MQDWIFEAGSESLSSTNEPWLTPMSFNDLPTTWVPPVDVTGPGPSDWDPSLLWDGYDTSGHSESDPTFEDLTDCFQFLDGDVVPDGATYVVPEGVSNQYIMAAIIYLQGLNPIDKLFAFKAMYEDITHPHFLDFKEVYANEGNARTTYWSDAKGGWVVDDSVFAAAGNFIFGFVGVMGGIDADILRSAAAALQEGDTGPLPQDAPEDVPHVELGISLAQSWFWNDREIFDLDSCGD